MLYKVPFPLVPGFLNLDAEDLWTLNSHFKSPHSRALELIPCLLPANLQLGNSVLSVLSYQE